MQLDRNYAIRGLIVAAYNLKANADYLKTKGGEVSQARITDT